MQLKLKLSSADLEILTYQARRAHQTLRGYLNKVLAVVACDLRQQPPKFRLTHDDCWRRRRARVEQIETFEELGCFPALGAASPNWTSCTSGPCAKLGSGEAGYIYADCCLAQLQTSCGPAADHTFSPVIEPNRYMLGIS